MVHQHDSVRLLAIALLNIADDEGYFLAAPGYIRSQVWPLTESSVSAHDALITLAEISYIEIKKHPTHGEIGCVLNFKKHQHINRPSPSKLKSYYVHESSVIIHGAFTERSLLEQGSGNRERKVCDELPFGNSKPDPVAKPELKPAKTKERKRPEIASHAHGVVIHWCEVWKNEKSSSYVLTGKDRAAAKDIGSAIGGNLERFREVAKLYLADNDSFLERNGWPLYLLKDRLNKYLPQTAEPPPPGMCITVDGKYAPIEETPPEKRLDPNVDPIEWLEAAEAEGQPVSE